MTDRVSISAQPKQAPELRKLARALIALARRQLAEEELAGEKQPPTEQAS